MACEEKVLIIVNGSNRLLCCCSEAKSSWRIYVIWKYWLYNAQHAIQHATFLHNITTQSKPTIDYMLPTCKTRCMALKHAALLHNTALINNITTHCTTTWHGITAQNYACLHDCTKLQLAVLLHNIAKRCITAHHCNTRHLCTTYNMHLHGIETCSITAQHFHALNY